MTPNQKRTCTRLGVECVPSPAHMKLGISAAALAGGVMPLNGLRHPPKGDTTGWYIWAGEEYSEDPDFFLPLHVSHLAEVRPEVLPYLGRPPGWRFLVAGDYEDLWFDATLLGVD